jgi:hypothetical protein
VGYNALKDSLGDNNTAVGTTALKNATGTQNTALGTTAGFNLATGDNNIYIGFGADTKDHDASNASANNEIVIGANTTGNGSNTTTIGNSSTTTTYIDSSLNTTGNIHSDGMVSGLINTESFLDETDPPPGTPGDIRFDSNFVYICTVTNTWKRVSISTF